MYNQAFNLYPAIDILGGACVRLHKGDYDASTQYSDDPVDMASRWMDAGARWLHVVDLDGAKAGEPVNLSTVTAIVEAARKRGVRVEVGGGIRSHESLRRWLETGATRCVIGTLALDTAWMSAAVQMFGSDSLIAGLDGRDGKMAVRGWLDQTEVRLTDVAMRLKEVGVRYALVTDVERDGTLEGANLELAKAVQDAGLQAIASGGIRNLSDVLAAKQAGLLGAIAGRSIYDGTLDVKTAIDVLADEEGRDPSC